MAMNERDRRRAPKSSEPARLALRHLAGGAHNQALERRAVMAHERPMSRRFVKSHIAEQGDALHVPVP